MRTPSRRLAALALAGLVALAGCGGDDGGEDEAERSTTTEAPSSTSSPEASADAGTSAPADDESTTTEADEPSDDTDPSETPPDTSDQGQEGTGAPDGEAADVDWDLNAAQYRDQDGRRIAFLCPPDGEVSTAVWGTGTYTDDSSVCVAAVHAGLINPVEGGRVIVEIAPGEDSYEGSEANGVTSQDYGSWAGSFTFPRS